MPKGIQSLDQERERRGAAASRSGFVELKLRGDAKLARIRFLTDKDDLIWAYFHPVLTTTRLGKKFTQEVYCAYQDGQECSFCQHIGEPVASVKKRIFFWVWCYEIYHTQPDSTGKWAKAEYLDRVYYLEPINALRLLKTGPGQSDYIELRILGWAKRYKTLLDRDYDWSREGSSMEDTTYDLVPRDPSKLQEVIEKTKEQLPDLQLVLEQKKSAVQTSMQPSKVEEKPKKSLDEEIEQIFAEDESGSV